MPRDNTTSHPDLPELSNEDVAILYEIINVAYQAPNIHSLPFRCIFAAYDQVLGKHGISPAHDQLYLRFLFRLGERLGDGNDGEKKELFSEFEALLLELGIKLEVESAAGSIIAEEEVLPFDEDTENEESGYEYTTENTPTTIGRGRRASFSVVLDLASEANRARQDRPESPASISRLQDVSDGFGSRPFRTKQPRQDHDSTLEDSIPIIKGNRLEDAVKQFRKKAHSISHNRNDDSHELFQARSPDGKVNSRSRHRKKAQDFEIYEDSIERNVLLIPKATRIPDELRLKQKEILESRMQQDAEAFDHIRTRKLVRLSIRKWYAVVLQRQHRRLQMMHVAIQYDRRELLKQSWAELIQKHNENKKVAEAQKRIEDTRRQAVEQEQYLKWREENAAKARDVYLVAKAFSHWANCAIERVEENAVARRHLVRLRYFNAWKEITAVNELKVRRMVLKRFLTAWQRKIRDVTVLEDQAVVALEKTLIRSAYSKWSWQFGEHRALAWRTGMLAQKYFLRWVIAVRVRAEQRLSVIKTRDENIQKSQLRRLADRFRYQQSLVAKAESFRDRHLVSNVLVHWKKTTQLMPVARQVSGVVSKRTVSTIFETLKHRRNAAQQARDADARRLLRNMWTVWNDRLRIETMQHQICDRLLMEVLYKWVLVERGALMKRVHEERLQRQAIRGLFIRKAEMQHHTLRAEGQVSRLRNTRLKRMALQLWIQKRDQLIVQTEQADMVRQPRVKSQIMHQWHAAHEHQAQISRWSVEAAFYLRGQRSIKKWKAAVEQSQKQKRREAYSVVKRAYHKDLASRALEQWKHRSSQMTVLLAKEQEYQDRRTRNMCLAIWKHWSQQTDDYSLMLSQASGYRSDKLLSQPFESWRSGTQLATRNTAVAASFFASCVQKNAYDSLRRLQLKIFELRSHEAKASSVYTWTSKRRARGLLRAWAERASSRRSNQQPETYTEHDSPFADSGPLLPEGTPLISLAKTPRTRRNQPFLADLPPQTPFYNFSNPPAHLSTPSQRSAQARSILQAQTTFPPLQTQQDLPVESLLSVPSPPSDASSHHTTTTSPTQASMAHTIQDHSRPTSKDQTMPAIFANSSTEVHNMHGGPAKLYFCPFVDCKRHREDFSRRENLIEHIRRVHKNQNVDNAGSSPLKTGTMESPFPMSRQVWRNNADLPATDVQPQRRRQTGFLTRGENTPVASNTSAGTGLRRSLFPNARLAGSERLRADLQQGE